MQGGVIDIIPNVFNDIGKYQSLAKQGAFADLNTFIENDPQIENDMLFSHVLETTEINDQLTFMPLSFSINTLIGKTKYVGSKENWKIDDLKQHWESAKKKVNFSYHSSKDYVYYDLLRGCLNSFIDYDNAKCYFNSDEFIELLDFINTFDEPLTYKEDVDYLADTFIKDVSIYGFEGYHKIIWNKENDDVTFVGYLKKSEYDRLVDYINNIKAGETCIEEELQTIITDEIWAVFEGEMTSKEAADNIQNRVSILVSERYG